MNGKMKASALCISAALTLNALPVSAAEEEPAANEPVVMDAVVTLSGTTATAEGSNVTVDGNKITVTASGAYEFSGTLDDGQIIVNVADIVADPGTVKLYFNGVTVTGASEAAVYVMNAENTSINLMDGTENFLYDCQTYTETTAVIYAKDDLTIKSYGELGDGKLRIEALYQQGIHCNNDVKITGGNVKVRTEVGDGIRGKTSVQIKGGKLDVNAGGDGVKSTKGDVLISGGESEIKAGNDAVQGETSVQISGGSLKANGDRGLTNAASGAVGGGAVTITGGTILATATDSQAIVALNTQNVVMFHMTAQQVKDQAISLTDSETKNEIFSMIPDKKFDYVLISSPELTTGLALTLSVAGYPAENGSFTVTNGVNELGEVTSTAPAVTDDPFDVNLDGTCDVKDGVILARIIANDDSLTVEDAILGRADVNGSGTQDSDDLVMVLRHIAHLDV